MHKRVEKTPTEIHFTYLGNEEIYRKFKTSCIISILFSTKCHYVIILSSSVQIILMFFIQHVLKFKYQPGNLTVKNKINGNSQDQ
jgi:hypothetical protein